MTHIFKLKIVIVCITFIECQRTEKKLHFRFTPFTTHYEIWSWSNGLFSTCSKLFPLCLLAVITLITQNSWFKSYKSLKTTGTIIERSRLVLEMTGTKIDPPGLILETTRTRIEWLGLFLEMTVTSIDRLGLVLEIVGMNIDRLGLVLETSTDLDTS